MAESFIQPGVATTLLFRLQEIYIPSTSNTVEMENIVISDPTTAGNMAKVDNQGRLKVNNFEDLTGSGDIVQSRQLLQEILLELKYLNNQIAALDHSGSVVGYE